MRIWGISDLHLSFSTNKPMDIFGDNWTDHATSMQQHWDALVAPEDYVLIPGDISWAMRLEDAKADLAWIGERPGKKILGRGNHDYWWSSISKVRAALPANCIALQNDAVDLGDVVVAGTRLWAMPGALDYKPEDLKIYERELIRLRLSLEMAKKIAPDKPIIAAVHYPPFTKTKDESAVTKILEEFGVKICVYGHLHGERSHVTAKTGLVNGVRYHLIACDFLKFKPVQIFLGSNLQRD